MASTLIDRLHRFRRELLYHDLLGKMEIPPLAFDVRELQEVIEQNPTYMQPPWRIQIGSEATVYGFKGIVVHKAEEKTGEHSQ